jgi:hypothetical protein
MRTLETLLGAGMKRQIRPGSSAEAGFSQWEKGVTVSSAGRDTSARR